MILRCGKANVQIYRNLGLIMWLLFSRKPYCSCSLKCFLGLRFFISDSKWADLSF